MSLPSVRSRRHSDRARSTPDHFSNGIGHVLALGSTFAAELRWTVRGRRATDDRTGAEAEFRAVAETASDAIVSASSEGRITFFNRAAEEMFGRSSEESLGQPLTMLMPERLRAAHTGGFTRFVQTGESRLQGRPVEVSGLRGDGSEFVAQLSLAHWYRDGQVFSTAIVRDMSERARAEAALRAALEAEQQVTERLQQVDAMKSTLLHTVSHDLRTPIAAILTLTQVLRTLHTKTDGPSQQTQLRLLASIDSTARKMERLLGDLISAERMGSTEPKRAWCDLGALALGVIDETGIRDRHPVHTHCEDAAAYVDASQVERIVENLLRNVMEHVPEGRPVWVGVESTQTGVTISVEDAGPGIPGDLQQHVFEVFRRGPDAAPGGSGIGLSLVSRFARMHDGNAWVEDRPGGGAAFRVYLPGEREES